MNFKINKTIKRLTKSITLVWQSGPVWTIASTTILIIQGIFRILALYIMKLVIDTITVAITAPKAEMGFGHIGLLIMIEGVIYLLLALSDVAVNWISDIQVEFVTDYLHKLLHTKSIEADLEYYENSKYHDILHRSRREVIFRPAKILRDLIRVERNALSLLAMSALLFYFHWAIALILFVNVVPGILVRIKYSGILYKWQRDHAPIERKVWYFHWILTGDSFAKEIKLFDSGKMFMERYNNIRTHLRNERFKITTKRAIAEGVSHSGATIAIFASYVFIAFRTVQRIITMGDLLLYYQAFQRGQRFLQDMFGGLAALYEDTLFLTDLFDFLSLKRKVPEPNFPRPVPKPMQKGIVFDRVTFQYPNEPSRIALDEVSFTIHPGEKIALVGENGSGKTTLIKLLCRLYDPTKGSITIDGIDLREFQTKELRSEFSIIFQDFSRYNLTAKENIGLSNLRQSSDLNRIKKAGYHSGVDKTITKLERGYDTILGKLFDDGEEISSGEWQKMALARAFFRDSQVIVLDEPTSAMDAEAEYKLLKRICEIPAERTIILISHRFSTIRMADSIYVLDAGRIVENGTHQELMNHGSKYARMFEKQAEVFRSGMTYIPNFSFR
jgi:ATP-binding cassette subfamily B protein